MSRAKAARSRSRRDSPRPSSGSSRCARCSTWRPAATSESWVVVSDAVRALRAAAPSALAVLVRRYGDFEACEDAVQEALIAASAQWPREGVPDSPRAWLVHVASRRYVDQVRSDVAPPRRGSLAAGLEPPPAPVPAVDDTLTLFLLCCHPALTRPSQVALTLRAVGGLTTAEIARAL